MMADERGLGLGELGAESPQGFAPGREGGEVVPLLQVVAAVELLALRGSRFPGICNRAAIAKAESKRQT